jgi:hypothetical protein
MILKLHHDIPLAGHRDFEKTYKSISDKYFWLEMHKEIKKYCASCYLCQTKKHLGKSSRAPLKTIIVRTPWGLIGLDFAGPLKKTINGMLYIILAICYFTKFCVAKAVKDCTALTAAKFVYEEVICRFGMPKSIISDSGVSFKAHLFMNLCKLLKISNSYSTFYHHEGIGLVERMVKTMKQILTMYVDVSHENWDEFLQPSISAYNTSVHSSSKYSPYEVLFGRKPTNIADVILSSPIVLSGVKSADDYLAELRANAEVIHRRVNENLDVARERQKRYYDRFINDSVQYGIGDLVLLVNERKLVGESKAFRNKTLGPFRVVDKFNDVNFRIVSLANGREQSVHYNRLRPFRERENETFESNLKQNMQVTMPSYNLLVNNDRHVQVNGYNSGYFDFLLYNLSVGGGSNANEEDEEGEEAVEVVVDEEFLNLEFIFAEVPVEVGDGYKCDLCEKVFETERGKKSHMSRSHKEVNGSSNSGEGDEVFEDAVGENEQVANEQVASEQVTCEICQNQFKNFRGLKTHISRMHKEVVSENGANGQDIELEDMHSSCLGECKHFIKIMLF